jgi:beta-lactamase regulating signal transducer with metallopeptidase domain
MATLLAVLVAGVSRVCRRPALVHTLWLLVLLKLVTPSPLVLPVNWPAGWKNDQVTRWQGDKVTEDSQELVTLSPDHLVTLSPSRGVAEAVAAWLERAWGPLVVTVWLAGSALWFTFAGVRSYRFARLLRYGRPAPRELQYQAQRLAEDLGLGRCPGVWLLPGMLSPMLWGLGGRARLLLPADLVARLDPDQLRTLLVHELAHARRRDPWVRVFELLVLGLYWWHPVTWWARRRLREAEEQCCDAWVVWALPAAAPSYATALVETVAFLSAIRPALPPGASGVGYVRVLERRLTLILCGAPPRGVSVGGLLGVLGLGLLLLPWRPVWGQNEPADPPPAPEEPGAAVWAAVQPAADLVVPPVPVPAAADPKKEKDKGISQGPRPERGRGGRGPRDRFLGPRPPPDWRDQGFAPRGSGPDGFRPGPRGRWGGRGDPRRGPGGPPGRRPPGFGGRPVRSMP